VDMEALNMAAESSTLNVDGNDTEMQKQHSPLAHGSSGKNDSSKNSINPPADPVSYTSTSQPKDPESGGSVFRNFKNLFENECEENRRLRRRIDELNVKLAKQSISTNGDANGASSSTAMPSPKSTTMSDQERRNFERRIAALEYEVEASKQLKAENSRLKTENDALIRVLSKISRPEASPHSNSTSHSNASARRPNNYNPTTRN